MKFLKACAVVVTGLGLAYLYAENEDRKDEINELKELNRKAFDTLDELTFRQKFPEYMNPPETSEESEESDI